MRVIGSIGAALAVLLAAVPVWAADGKTWTTVKIATEGAYAPWNFSAPGGKLDGFEIELSAELCKRMKVTCEVVAQDWDGIIPALNAGKYDAIMAGMNITEKREQVLAFSRSYGGEPAGLGVELSGPLGKLPGTEQRFNLTADPVAAQKAVDAMKPMLKGKTIGVQVSTIHANFLDQYLKDTVEIREYKTTEQHDLDLLAGRLDGIFASGSALRATFAKPDFKGYGMAGAKFSGGVFGRGVAVGLRKTDPELKAMFDDAIAAVIADGTLKALAIKWFTVDISPEG